MVLTADEKLSISTGTYAIHPEVDPEILSSLSKDAGSSAFASAHLILFGGHSWIVTSATLRLLFLKSLAALS